MSASNTLSPRPSSLRAPLRTVLVLVTVLLAAACGDDDEPTPQETCDAACRSAVGTCAPIETLTSGCSLACQVGYGLAPACGPLYESVLTCVGGRPFVQCTESSITVSTAVTECADALGDYLGCIASDVLPACLDVPLGDAACAEAGQAPRARACLGQPAGCTLYAGTVGAGGVGTFCCP